MKNEKGTQFSKDRQPSPEAKSKGWERRRVALEIMNELDAIRKMPYEELENMKQNIKAGNFKGYTVQQVKLMQYMGSSKFTTDWLDRHISKAPSKVESEISLEGDFQSLLKILHEQVDKRDVRTGSE